MSTTLAKPRARGATAKNPLLRLRQEIDALMARFEETDQNELFPCSFTPTLDLSETADAFELRMDIPGVQASEIDVQVHGNTVTLSGARGEEKSEEGKTFHRLERHCGTFSRTVTLPSQVKAAEVTATYASGVLTVSLPKCDQEHPRRIEVKA
jgi:HSP20 family protein